MIISLYRPPLSCQILGRKVAPGGIVRESQASQVSASRDRDRNKHGYSILYFQMLKTSLLEDSGRENAEGAPLDYLKLESNFGRTPTGLFGTICRGSVFGRMPLPTIHQKSVGISGSLVHLDVCTKVAWDDSHPGGSISVVLLPLWRTSARVNRRIGFVRQWDDASARLWSNVEPGRCIHLIESQISALSVSRYEIWGPNEGHAVKRHDLASFTSHLSYLPVLEMTNSSAVMLSPLRASSLRNGRKHPSPSYGPHFEGFLPQPRFGIEE